MTTEQRLREIEERLSVGSRFWNSQPQADVDWLVSELRKARNVIEWYARNDVRYDGGQLARHALNDSNT